jgi:hypothetical protein
MSTPSTSIADSQRFLNAEKRAEQWALTVLHGTTFTDCLKMNGLAPSLEVSTPEGKTVTIRGSDIYDSRTWKKFLASISQEEGIYQLTGIGENVAGQYKSWLLNEHTARYRVLSANADLAWLERVVTLAVTRHIMEQKYEAYTTQGLETFADPRVAIEMGNLIMLNHLAKEAARLIHHIVKEPGQARQLIEQFYEVHDHQMKARVLAMREQPGVLPPGTTPPLALQAQKEEESHE